MQKIIVLDDDESILEAITMVLTQKSMKVLALRDPSLLEQSLQPGEPGLLLMDIFLGKYDGRQICRELKNNPKFSQLLIILFTAQNYTLESIEQSGADAILNKPFSINKLMDTINSVLTIRLNPN